MSYGGGSQSSKMLSSNKSGVGGLSVLSNNGPCDNIDVYFNNEDLNQINNQLNPKKPQLQIDAKAEKAMKEQVEKLMLLNCMKSPNSSVFNSSNGQMSQYSYLSNSNN